MTAALDNSLQTISRLIDSCWRSEDSFRGASAAVTNSALKRLFAIYAQQRGRFAEELSSFTPGSVSMTERPMTIPQDQSTATDSELVSACLEREKHNLELYRGVLAERTLPTKARFLVSAQLALLERVYSRIETLHPQTNSARANTERMVL
jgi:hypothetical protein